MSFLSKQAQTSKSNNKRPYTIEEDRLICAGLEEGITASAIVDSLAEEDFERSVLSIRYRISKLREAADEFDSLEAFHKASK